jgi:hypothetical protein
MKYNLETKQLYEPRVLFYLPTIVRLLLAILLTGKGALVEKGSTPAGRFIFTDGSSYPPTVLFLVAIP